MSLIYKNQAKLEKLSVKVNLAGNFRISDHQASLFGGHANSFDELKYLRNQNGDAQAINQKQSDAYVKYAPANSSGSTSNRFDQQYHDFLTNGSYA